MTIAAAQLVFIRYDTINVKNLVYRTEPDRKIRKNLKQKRLPHKKNPRNTDRPPGDTNRIVMGRIRGKGAFKPGVNKG